MSFPRRARMGPCGNIEAYYSRIGNTRSILDRPPIFVFLPRVRFLLASLLFRLVPLFSSSLVPPGSLVFSPAINFFITSTNFSVPPVSSEIFSLSFLNVTSSYIPIRVSSFLVFSSCFCSDSAQHDNATRYTQGNARGKSKRVRAFLLHATFFQALKFRSHRKPRILVEKYNVARRSRHVRAS